MSDPATARNRLDEEQSPYLRQHEDNPVNWQPWDEQALDAARERDVPIFLSVGYSACHWCHVMEDESFEDEEVAAVLNEGFVPIKVDREERPDLDSIYQTICQMVTNQGGWPLSVWLTPEGKPFYVGTYFPKESMRGRPGFLDLLENVARSWREDREEVENRADQWTAALEGELEDVPDQPGEAPGSDLLETAAQAAVRSADREWGGFGGGGPKFPQTSRVELLLAAYDRTGRDPFREVAGEALDAMARRGMYDHVGGGFYRYATDRQWTVPHFEKMLYDNAELPRVYCHAYRLTGEGRYADVARETFAFVERELTHPGGGFFSTLDAQSEGEEGKFYVWTPAELRDAIDDETDADLFVERYGVTESGNFEGRNNPVETATVADLATEYDLSPEEAEQRLGTARQQVFDARSQRVRPARDEKVLAGWNGLMIAALAEGALAFDDAYADQAADALEFVREHLWDGDRLSRRYKDGDVKGDGYLEDYAYLARGALALYEATGERDHLEFALDLARATVAEFWDDERGTLYFTPESGEQLVTRPQEVGDQSTPSSLGVALDVLLALDHLAPGEGFAGKAERALETHASRIEANPLQHATLALAADRHAAGSLEVTVVADDLPGSWRERLGRSYLPHRLLARRPPDENELTDWVDALGLGEVPPIWADRSQREGEPTAYVCRSFTCSPPLTDVDEAVEWIEDCV
jgi:uncharacterized protein YyaL (SSP411 family)